MSREKYFSEEQVDEIVSRMAAKLAVPVISIGDGDVPLGMKGLFDAIVAPPGWLVADGSVHNIEDYPELATHYASVHGAANYYGGNGTTTFAVPDWRGEFFRAAGTNSHTNQGSGANVGVHQDGTESPTVFINNVNRIYFGKKDTARTPINADSVIGFTDNTGRSIFNATSTDTFVDVDPWGMQSGNTNYTSRPTNTSLLCCVKAVPSGHRYSTKEQVVGKWIDGSDIYEKTFVGDGTLSLAKGWTNIDSYFGVTVSSLNRITRFELSGNDGTLVFNIGEMEISGNNLRVYDFTTDTVSDGVLTLLYTKTTS